MSPKPEVRSQKSEARSQKQGQSRLLASRFSFPASSRSGFTLVEVLLALGITVMIGGTVMLMLFSMSSGTRNKDELRRQNVRLQVAGHRIDTAIRSSRMVLAAGDQFVVLWMADTRRNQSPDLSELLRIEWDQAQQEVRSYAAPPDLHPDDDQTYELSADFDEITADLRDTPRFSGQTLASRATAWEISPANAGSPTRVLHYLLTLQSGDQSATVQSTVTLRGE